MASIPADNTLKIDLVAFELRPEDCLVRVLQVLRAD